MPMATKNEIKRHPSQKMRQKKVGMPGPPPGLVPGAGEVVVVREVGRGGGGGAGEAAGGEQRGGVEGGRVQRLRWGAGPFGGGGLKFPPN